MSCKKAKGIRAKTRRKLKRKGARVTVTKFLSRPKVNQKVLIEIDSSIHSGMPGIRYNGKNGIVKSVGRENVEVLVGKGGNVKTLNVHAIHLRVLEGETK